VSHRAAARRRAGRPSRYLVSAAMPTPLRITPIPVLGSTGTMTP
jgi:hypothetical protein